MVSCGSFRDLLPTPMISDAHRLAAGALDMPNRLLLGAGPSNPNPRVMQALMGRTVGHLDPTFLRVMDDIREMLRYAWQTENEHTLLISGTGTAGMEAAVANAVEPGDVVVVAVAGYFGDRIAQMAARYGADVKRLEVAWGEAFPHETLAAAVETHRPAVLAVVHAETSTGVLQPLDGLGALCRANDCLLLVDSVTSFGGVPLLLDASCVDVAYSGSQKCMAAPSGVAPLTFSPRAMDKLARRKVPVRSWYLDYTLLSKYWGADRAYHHTAPINMVYAMRESLRIVCEEGLEARWARHRAAAEHLWEGLSDMGLECHVAPEFRVPSLTTVRVPEGVDARGVVRQLLDDHDIEISGGLGQLAGKVWRVGLMGYNARSETADRLLKALAKVLGR